MTETKQNRVFSIKYRPATFDELIGQAHVCQTLRHALDKSKIAHGYIFAGPRGVGKTSAARIFAKALISDAFRAGKDTANDEACREVDAGISMDVIEMDGASNRKIEDIRQLRENVRFAPTRGKYKVYIIDEVHMLTTEAFNALLKTLEEPPEHVVFILATTDPQKIPETIHSRCQRLDFRPVSPLEMRDCLEKIAKLEKIKVDAAALEILADLSEGSVRDGLSTLEQAASFGEGKISEEIMTSLFGLTDARTVMQAAEAVAEGNRDALFALVDRLAEDGRDLGHFLVQLARFWRRVITSGAPQSIADRITQEALLALIERCLKAEGEIRYVRQPHLCLMVHLSRMVEEKDAPSLRGLIDRLEQMEKRLAGSAQVGSSAAPGGDVQKIWPAVLAKIEAESGQLAGYLKSARIGRITGRSVELLFGHSLHMQRVGADTNRKLVERALDELLGGEWRIETAVADSAVPRMRPQSVSSGDAPLSVRAIADSLGGEIISDDT